MNCKIPKYIMWIRKLIFKFDPKLFQFCPSGNPHYLSEKYCYCQYESHDWGDSGIYEFGAETKKNTVTTEPPVDLINAYTAPIKCPYCGAGVAGYKGNDTIYFTCGVEADTHSWIKRWDITEVQAQCIVNCAKKMHQIPKKSIPAYIDKSMDAQPAFSDCVIKLSDKLQKGKIETKMEENVESEKLQEKEDAQIDLIDMEPI